MRQGRPRARTGSSSRQVLPRSDDGTWVAGTAFGTIAPSPGGGTGRHKGLKSRPQGHVGSIPAPGTNRKPGQTSTDPTHTGAQDSAPSASAIATRSRRPDRAINIPASAWEPQAVKVQRFVPGIESRAILPKSPITRCIDSNAVPPEVMTPRIASMRSFAGAMSGIIAIAAFASLTPGTPDI